MKILVYGAGVIGSYLTHVLCRAGHEVTLLCRGSWRETLMQNGLTIRHSIQRKTTVDHPRILAQPDGTSYDAVFAVMQHQQLFGILDDLAGLQAPLVILVGNNLSASLMERELLLGSASPKTILFGFQVTAGSREGAVVHCVRANGGEMTIGSLHGPAPEAAKKTLSKIFAGTGYRLNWEDEMDGWYKSHLAFILPLAYLCYTVDCDLRRCTRAQRKQLLDAADEGYTLLRTLKIPIRPVGEDSYYRPGIKRLLCVLIVFGMAKARVGELCASAHCRHAVTQMEGLDKAWAALRAETDLPMPAWDAMRRSMPDWETLHRRYDPNSFPKEAGKDAV